MTKSSKLSPSGPSASSTVLIYIKIRHPLCPQISRCRATYVPALAPPRRGFSWTAGPEPNLWLWARPSDMRLHQNKSLAQINKYPA
jgi:hypothetical protein